MSGSRGFEMSGLRLDIFGQPLTNSYNRQVRRGETASGNAAGVQSWSTMKNAETNGETENARNVGQLGSCGSTCGVNNMEGNRRENRELAPQVIHRYGTANGENRRDHFLLRVNQRGKFRICVRRSQSEPAAQAGPPNGCERTTSQRSSREPAPPYLAVGFPSRCWKAEPPPGPKVGDRFGTTAPASDQMPLIGRGGLSELVRSPLPC